MGHDSRTRTDDKRKHEDLAREAESLARGRGNVLMTVRRTRRYVVCVDVVTVTGKDGESNDGQTGHCLEADPLYIT